jgi:hypothetical protein
MRPAIGTIRAAAFLFLLAGCQTGLGPSEETLNAAKLRWAELDIRDYSMLVTNTLSAGPLAAWVTVTNRVVTDRRFDQSSGQVPTNQASLFPDVPAMFALLEDALKRAHGVNVSFDGNYGYPVSIYINYDPRGSDDDVFLGISGFLEGGAAGRVARAGGQP